MIYVDRSRYLKGLQQCARARFWEYSAFGTGFREKAQDIFLATGTALHAGLEGLLKAVLSTEVFGRDRARDFISSAIAEYRATIARQGISGAVPPGYEGQSEVIVNEQACLVEGLYWCFYRALLPWLLENFEIVAVEQEEEYLAAEDVTIMSRPDFVALSKVTGELAIFDFKSLGGYQLDTREHEHIIQVIFGSLGVERRYEKPCTSHYFVGLHKGMRRESGKEGFKRQGSPLCYGYLRPSAGLLDPGDWKSSYEWEEGGKTRRVSKDYLKTPVWEAHFSEKPEGISNVEHLVFSQPLEFAAGQVSYLGPSQRPDYLVAKILAQVVAHEREWESRLKMVAVAEVEGVSVEEHGKVLDSAIPCSWDCYPYGRACSYQDICFESPGADDPLANSARWERRVPHHAPEAALEVFNNVKG